MGTKISATRVHQHGKLITSPLHRDGAQVQLRAIHATNVRLRREGIPAILLVTPDNRIVSYIYAELRTKTAHRATHKSASTYYHCSATLRRS